PTVYSFAHIGNFRTFLTGDLIVRTAEAIGWRVTYVSNITDVGHLTEDNVADASGEDKMARALHSSDGQRFNNVWELAEFFEAAFAEDWLALNLREPNVRPKATQHMREQILAAEDLIRGKHAYETPSGVYFAVDSFPEYGKLSGNTQENLLNAVRDVVVDENKRTQADFALWKKDDKHLMQWFSPFGWGFPGWHLECSVMARAYLGDTIDLHGGGEDLIFPHHECEIAQSESLTGKPFCNHWVHTRFLQVNGEKMAKSTGNYYTVRDLLAKGVDPLAIRYALMSGVYTKQLNFTDQSLRDASKSIERFRDADRLAAEAVASAKPGESPFGDTLDILYDETLDAMLNDLNTSVGLAKALEGARVIQRHSEALSKDGGEAAKRFLDRINALLGIVRHEVATTLPVVEPAAEVDAAAVERIIRDRIAAKAEKDFARADALRAEVEAFGVELQDTPTGTTWKAKSKL
ncbi:MAG TPA: cysteine--tRNA ligase, partial [Fimbriimonadaceae bacterium]|nr:cysteine--tRNA ligase [Fimbriimonadaceae bacterium]